jgi:aspartyl-tRNA(Asn)/glutamyl-tRNA(Gln) amidotransferase subunit A
VVPCETETLRWAGAVSLITMLSESAAQHADAVRGDPHGFGGEARALLTLDDELRDQRALLAAARQVLRSRTAQLFADARLDAVLTPTTACVAPLRHVDTVLLDNRDVPVATALSRFTAWASATGLPAISVPVPTPGLPLGMQLMAPPNREDLCLLLAGAIEGRPSGPA